MPYSIKSTRFPKITLINKVKTYFKSEENLDFNLFSSLTVFACHIMV